MMRKEKCAKCNLQNKKHRGGFTLVELIVILVILAILAALLIPALTGYIDKAKKKQVVAETRMIHSAIQTVVAEVYASDEWEEYAKKATGSPDNAIAKKDGTGKVKKRYDEIVKLAEVPSLDSKGVFTAAVTENGKVMTVIYQNGKGQVGIYFGETQEYIAYDASEFNNLTAFDMYKNCVNYVEYNADPGSMMWYSKEGVFATMGYQQQTSNKSNQHNE